MKNISQVIREEKLKQESTGLEKKKIKPNRLKYHLVVEWPGTCRNRSAKTLQTRPDLVHRMNEYTQKLIAVCSIYKNPIQIDQNYNVIGIRTWWKDGSDLYHFLMNLKKHDFQVVPELGVINKFSQKLILFKIQIDDNGVTVF